MLDWLFNGPVRDGTRRPIAAVAAGAGLVAAVAATLAAGAERLLAQQPGATPAVETSKTVTFTRDIAPLLVTHCAACHRPGAIAGFSLLTFDDVRPRARAIKQATRTRSMPPWKPEPGYGGPFVGDRQLTDAQIELITTWVDAGAPEGNPTDLAPLPVWPEGWQLGEPDLVIEMPEPYTLGAEGDDVLRKFAIPIPLQEMRYVQGLEFEPGNRGVVHHANLRIDRTPASRQLDAADPVPGYEGITPFDARYPDGHFLGWTPGQVRPLAADGMAWRLHPGSDLLLELHMMPSGQPEVVWSRIALFFTDEAPTKTPFTIRLGKQHLDIPPGASDYQSVDRYVLPVDVEVYGVQPHAHYLATAVQGRATLPDGTSHGLISIADWDFDWQDSYRYAEPLFLPTGTELTMEFTFDNSVGNRRNPRAVPERVTWGQKSWNEMGDLWIQVVPRDPVDLAILERDRWPQEMAEDIVGFEMVLDAEPDQVMVHNDVALLYLEFGRVAEAAAHFRDTMRLTPDSAAAHYNLGTTLLQLGDLDGAMAQFEQALGLDPDYAQAHSNLGAVLRSQGRLAEAIHHFRRAIVGHPDDGDALYNLANALTAQGAQTEAVTFYWRALQAQPNTPEPFAELAWMLATDPDLSLQDARQAVGLAERAAQLTSHQDASVLDSLAAAYAAMGRFGQAEATARAALALLPSSQHDVTLSIQQRLDLYTDRRPYRRPR